MLGGLTINLLVRAKKYENWSAGFNVIAIIKGVLFDSPRCRY